MRFLRVAVTVCALGVEISAQQPPFSTGVSLVSVPVTVTGRDGQMPAVALTSADFRVFENGDRQAVTLVSRDRRPVSLCLVLDSSGSMQGDLKRELAVRIGREIIAGLAPVDEVAIVLFSQQPEVVLPWTRVTDVPAINWARWQPHGWTSIVDAMHAALAQAESARNPRSIIALITDGFDTSSRSALSSVVKTRRQSETTVYAYWTGVAAPGARRLPDAGVQSGSGSAPEFAPPPMGLDVNLLGSLVGDSGGAVYRLQDISRASAAVRMMLSELNGQYTLGYTPSKPFDGKYRKLKVDSTRRGVRVRHRGGYLALP